MEKGYSAGQSHENFSAAEARVRESGPSRHLSEQAKAMLTPWGRQAHLADFRECRVEGCVRR